MSVNIDVHPERPRIGVAVGPFLPREYELVRVLPGRKRWVEGKLNFELTLQNIRYLKNNFPDANWISKIPLDLLREEETRSAKIQYEKSLKMDPIEAKSYPFKTKPFDHQSKAFFLSRDEEFFGLFMEMGTGKTKVGVDTAAYLYHRGEIDAVLITAPNGVHRQWIDEQFPTHCPDWCKWVGIAYKSSSSKGFLAEYDAVHKAEDRLRVFSYHVDAFSTENGVKRVMDILKKFRVLWIVDESTRIKASKAQRTKNILRLAPQAKFRRIMSGAPITKGVEDLYTQFQFLSPDILGFSSFWTFRAHYCVTQPVAGGLPGAVKIVGYQNIDELKERVDGSTFRVTKAECLDLPEKIYTTRNIEMTPEQDRMYEQMKEDLLVKLQDGSIIEAPLAVTQLIKLQQIVCGFIIDEEGVVKRISNNRARLVAELADEAQGQVLIWSRFQTEIDMIGEELKKLEIPFVEYHGRIDQQTRAQNMNRFQNNPEIKVFLSNPQAGGTGLNLANASTAIYASNDFNADTRWQSEDRIHRIGQKLHATYIDIVCRGTIDTKVLSSLRAKKNVATSVLDVRDLLE